MIDPVGIDLHLPQPVDRGGADIAVIAGTLGHHPVADIAARDTPMRKVSCGFWWTNPQSERCSARKVGACCAPAFQSARLTGERGYSGQ